MKCATREMIQCMETHALRDRFATHYPLFEKLEIVRAKNEVEDWFNVDSDTDMFMRERHIDNGSALVFPLEMRPIFKL